MNLPISASLALFSVASSDDSTNRPLAIATIVISVIAIVAVIIYTIRRRPEGATALPEPVLKATGSVEWYANEVGDDLLDADPAQRAKVVEDASKRVKSAHAQLLELASTADDQDWNVLMVQLTATERAYSEYARASDPDPGIVKEQQYVLRQSVEEFREQLASKAES